MNLFLQGLCKFVGKYFLVREIRFCISWVGVNWGTEYIRCFHCLRVPLWDIQGLICHSIWHCCMFSKVSDVPWTSAHIAWQNIGQGIWKSIACSSCSPGWQLLGCSVPWRTPSAFVVCSSEGPCDLLADTRHPAEEWCAAWLLLWVRCCGLTCRFPWRATKLSLS